MRIFGIKENELNHKRIMIVFGSGGHTTEMLLMIKSLQFGLYREVIFVIGHSDTWSLTKIKDFFKKNRNIDIDQQIRNVTIKKVFRSREVKQSYVTSIFTTVVVTNGPGTSVPICYAHYFFSKLLMWNIKAKILFIESFCRVTTLSLTGKLLYPITNLFIVHWQELQRKHPKTILFKDKLL